MSLHQHSPVLPDFATQARHPFTHCHFNMTDTSKTTITFQCTLKQRAAWLKLTSREMCASLNDWIVETLDDYANDRLEDDE